MNIPTSWRFKMPKQGKSLILAAVLIALGIGFHSHWAWTLGLLVIFLEALD